MKVRGNEKNRGLRTRIRRVAFEQEGQHPLTGRRAANFRLLANQ